MGNICLTLAFVDAVAAYVTTKSDVLHAQFGTFLFSGMLLVAGAAMNWTASENYTLLADRAEARERESKTDDLKP